MYSQKFSLKDLGLFTFFLHNILFLNLLKNILCLQPSNERQKPLNGPKSIELSVLIVEIIRFVLGCTIVHKNAETNF